MLGATGRMKFFIFVFLLFSALWAGSGYATSCQTGGRTFDVSDVVWSKYHKSHLYCAGDGQWRYLAQWAITGADNAVYLAGNVGVGTSSLHGRLHVTAPDHVPTIVMQGEGDGNALLQFSSSAGLTGVEGGGSDGDLGFYTSGHSRMYLSKDGYLGIGTETPHSRLHVEGRGYFSGHVGIGVENPQSMLHLGGHAVPLILEAPGGHSNDAVWISFKNSAAQDTAYVGLGSSASEGMHLWSYRDKVLVGTSLAHPILFYTSYESAGGGSERMRIEWDGRIGIGTNSPKNLLSVNGILNIGNTEISGTANDSHRRFFISPTGHNQGYLWSTLEPGNNQQNIILQRHSTSGSFIHFHYYNSTIGTISTNGTSTLYNTTSDYRLKENIMPLAGALDRVMLLRPSRFIFKGDNDRHVVEGFLAHEVQQIAPYAVIGEKDGVNERGEPDYQQVDYGKLTPLLAAAIQDLKAENDFLRAELEVIRSILGR